MSTMTVTRMTRTSPIALPHVRAAHPSLRLTRRGRLVILALFVLVVFTAGILLSGGSVATERPEETRLVMVGTGDTLWEIAGAVAGDGDVRDMVARIQRLNGLDSSMVAAGQKLRVPLEAG